MEEFQHALREFGVRLSNGEVRRVFMIFDDEKSGAIKYEEFMHGLKGGATFSLERQAVAICIKMMDFVFKNDGFCI